MSDLFSDQYHNVGLSPREYSIIVERDEAKLARYILISILILLIVFLVWAFLAEMETLTRGIGKVIPSSKVKIVQHFEGGIVREILAQEGELVSEGQAIVTIDNTKAESEFQSVTSRLQFAIGKVARLEALAGLTAGNEQPIKFTADFKKNNPEIVLQEQLAYDSAKAEYTANILEFQKRIESNRLEAASIRQEIGLRQQQIIILQQTIDAYLNLRGARAVSRMEMDEKQNHLIESKLTVATLIAKLPQMESGAKEIKAQLSKYVESFRYDTIQKLNEAKAEVESSQAVSKDRQESLNRTEVVSPITGVINQLYVTAPGEVIRPGGEVAEIVPVDDKLIAEVLIPPQEIGFIHVGQTARIKVTAFDSIRYGALNGQVISISSDTIQGPRNPNPKAPTNQEFYRVRASTDEVLKDRSGKILNVTSGMTLTMDIVTGRKTVAEFIFLPLVRGVSGSLRQQ